MAFVTRSTSSGKGNYRTSAGLAGDVVAKLGKIDQSIAQTYKNDLKKYEKFLEDQTKVEEEEVKDDDQIIVDKSKDLDELFELLNN
jgi:hypothetical protein